MQNANLKGLSHAVYRETARINRLEKMIDKLEVSDEYKVNIFKMVIHRGILSIYDYKKSLTFIGNNGCYVIEELMKNKACGIDTIERFAECDDLQTRAYIYSQVKDKSISLGDAVRLLESATSENLFSSAGVDL